MDIVFEKKNPSSKKQLLINVDLYFKRLVSRRRKKQKKGGLSIFET